MDIHTDNHGFLEIHGGFSDHSSIVAKSDAAYSSAASHQAFGPLIRLS